MNNVVITTVIEMVEMVEILDGRLGKRSVERVRSVGHCEIWSHFTRTLYFHSPSARDNTSECVGWYSTNSRTRPGHTSACHLTNTSL